MTNAGGIICMSPYHCRKGRKKSLDRFGKDADLPEANHFSRSGVQPSSFLACSPCTVKTDDWCESAKQSKWIDKGLGIVEVSNGADT